MKKEGKNICVERKERGGEEKKRRRSALNSEEDEEEEEEEGRRKGKYRIIQIWFFCYSHNPLSLHRIPPNIFLFFWHKKLAGIL
jgi:hypothetical protein